MHFRTLNSILSIVPEIILSILRRLRHFFNNVLKYAERSEALRHPLVNIILYERIRMKLNLPDVTNSNSVSVINSNFAAIEQELQNKVLYRDNPSGEPNTLETALDANGKEIYNVGTLRTTDLYIDGVKVTPAGVDGGGGGGGTDISGLLVKTANLNDVQSKPASRANLGLGNVDNTSDANKPISSATASALAGKQATLVSGVNVKTINSNSILGTGDLVLTGVGETNTTSNLGAGQGIAAPKSGTNLPFKSLVAGTNVTLTPTANDITINAVVNTSSNPWLNVVDFGADKNGFEDSAAAFQDAVNALPAGGGRIIVPDGTFKLSFQPNIGTKSVYWDISVSTVFTGAGSVLGSFPYVTTAFGQKSVGPLIKSQSMQNVGNPNGGIAVFQIDMLQPDAYGAGNSLAMYLGAKSNNPNTLGNVWALNTLIEAGPATQGIHQCIEVDVNCDSTAALVKGISISGIGSQNPDVAIEIVRGADPVQTYWDRGIDIIHSNMAIQVRSSCRSGIVINEPAVTLDVPISAKQKITGGDTIVLQRNNDATKGNFIRGVNATNTANAFVINGNGDVYFQGGTYDGFVQINNQLAVQSIYIASNAAAGPAGVLNIGRQTFHSAGGLAGYIEIFIGSTPYKIPYNNF